MQQWERRRAAEQAEVAEFERLERTLSPLQREPVASWRTGAPKSMWRTDNGDSAQTALPALSSNVERMWAARRVHAAYDPGDDDDDEDDAEEQQEGAEDDGVLRDTAEYDGKDYDHDEAYTNGGMDGNDDYQAYNRTAYHDEGADNGRAHENRHAGDDYDASESRIGATLAELEAEVQRFKEQNAELAQLKMQQRDGMWGRPRKINCGGLVFDWLLVSK